MEKDKDVSKVWEHFFQHKDMDGRVCLLEHYRYLAKETAEHMCINQPDRINSEDLALAGIFGLMGAIQAYNLEKDGRFETFCIPMIRNTILNEIQAMKWIPCSNRIKTYELEKIRRKYVKEFGKEPTDVELAEAQI